MKLYLTREGRYVGTQAQAGRKGTWKAVEVPTDKAGLIEHLNGLVDQAEALAKALPGPTRPPAPAPRLNLDPPAVERKGDATDNLLIRWARAQSHNPDGFVADGLRRDIVHPLPLDECLKFASAALHRAAQIAPAE